MDTHTLKHLTDYYMPPIAEAIPSHNNSVYMHEFIMPLAIGGIL